MARTRIEINEELTSLQQLKDKVPSATAFGDSNTESIEAQIRVIEEHMTMTKAVDEFEDEGDYILSNALDAVRWLRDDDEAPSESWQELAGTEVMSLAS